MCCVQICGQPGCAPSDSGPAVERLPFIPKHPNHNHRYPCCVATLSRRTRDVIEAGFARSADGGAGHPLVSSRLHDFGFRGCTCVEQSVIGGAAHLLNFDGSDTMSAAYYVQVGAWDGGWVGRDHRSWMTQITSADRGAASPRAHPTPMPPSGHYSSR